MLADVHREKPPEENLERKVCQVCLDDPVLLVSEENQVKTGGASKVCEVYPVTMALQGMLEFQEHQGAQVRGGRVT